jgi:hypothetical protein
VPAPSRPAKGSYTEPASKGMLFNAALCCVMLCCYCAVTVLSLWCHCGVAVLCCGATKYASFQMSKSISTRPKQLQGCYKVSQGCYKELQESTHLDADNLRGRLVIHGVDEVYPNLNCTHKSARSFRFKHHRGQSLTEERGKGAAEQQHIA